TRARVFFFQAEDGIRDANWSSDVCSSDLEPPTAGASLVYASANAVENGALVRLTDTANGATAVATATSSGSFSVSIAAAIDDLRSEERRVGKEGRSWWRPVDEEQQHMQGD